MPVYEYRCEDCDRSFAVTRTISEQERERRAPACPDCQGRDTRRIYSPFFAKTSSKA